MFGSGSAAAKHHKPLSPSAVDKFAPSNGIHPFLYYTGSMDENGFEEVEHTADLALHIIADDFEGLLKIAAIGMLKLMGLASVKSGGRERKIEIEGIDREDLLVAWLEELLYLAERNGVGFGAMELRVSGNLHLVARIEEIPAMIPEKEIKAVTYHGLEVRETETGFEVTIVFDV